MVKLLAVLLQDLITNGICASVFRITFTPDNYRYLHSFLPVTMAVVLYTKILLQFITTDGIILKPHPKYIIPTIL